MNTTTSEPRKISQIAIKREVSRWEKGEDGKRKRVTKKVLAPRLVQTVRSGPRFGHYLIDTFIIFAVASGLEALFFRASAAEPPFGTRTPLGGFFFSSYYDFSSMFMSLLFYSAFEFLTGQTPGKMVTGTVVIDEYAERPGLGWIVLRSLIRYVPFEAFSCLSSEGRGWHDKWTSTYVVTKKEAKELKRILAGQTPEDPGDFYPEFELEGGQGDPITGDPHPEMHPDGESTN